MSERADLPEVRPGDMLTGRYRIEELLGAGGYGAVYRATQLALGREVAIKVVSTRYDDGAARFEREAAIAQRLEHPNTVRIYDYGTTASGLPFLVLELLRGRSLERVIAEEGPRTAASALHITAQILKSLMEAHALGIIHRDIKPANIFITSHPGEATFVKLLDFGLAKELTLRPGDKTQVALTRVGEVMGTPSYMAPEQVTGSVLTPRCDLYAVGLVLVEMLSARTLFDGPNLMAIAMAQVSPKPATLPPEVVGSVAEPVARRALEKSADKRYASAAEMLADVERALQPRAAPPRTSRRTLLLPIAGLCFAALVGAAVALALAGAGASDKRPRKSTATVDPGAPPPSGRPQKPRTRGELRLRSFERVEISAILEREGYTITNYSQGGSLAHQSSTIMFHKAPCAGWISIATFPPAQKQAVSDSYARTNPEAKLFIEDSRLLAATMYRFDEKTGVQMGHAACTDPLVQALTM